MQPALNAGKCQSPRPNVTDPIHPINPILYIQISVLVISIQFIYTRNTKELLSARWNVYVCINVNEIEH